MLLRSSVLLRGTAAGLFVVASGVCPAGVVRLGDWNVANHPNDAGDLANLTTVAKSTAARPIDVLAMVETDIGSKSSPYNSAALVASTFGSAYGATFAYVTTAADGGGDRTGFAYNTGTLQLLSTTTVTGITHPSLRALFRPVGTTGPQDFYYYAVHLQSGDDTINKNKRVDQATLLRADADALGNANVILGGDFNWQKADDVSKGVGAYRTFNAAGDGQLFDPVDQVGDWHANAAYSLLFSNDPGHTATTKMDDRFDMQLVSGELRDGVGLDYVAGSYRVFGNDGTRDATGQIAASANYSAGVVDALKAFSDHLPVIADYAFPDAVPEPATLTLAVAAVLTLGRRRRV